MLDLDIKREKSRNNLKKINSIGIGVLIIFLLSFQFLFFVLLMMVKRKRSRKHMVIPLVLPILRGWQLQFYQVHSSMCACNRYLFYSYFNKNSNFGDGIYLYFDSKSYKLNLNTYPQLSLLSSSLTNPTHLLPSSTNINHSHFIFINRYLLYIRQKFITVNYLSNINNLLKQGYHMYPYPIEKSSKLKKQIQRYFLPIEINPNFILDIVRLEQKKYSSPNKIKNQTITKLSQEARRFDLLKITGRQLNSNFAPFNIKFGKTGQSPRQTKYSPKKDVSRLKVQQMLSQPLQTLLETVSRDPDSHLFTRQLQQLSRYKSSCSEQKIKLTKSIKGSLITEPRKLNENIEQFENMILANPTLYRKMLMAYQKMEIERSYRMTSIEKKQKRGSLSDAVIKKQIPRGFKKMGSTTDKQINSQEMKKLNDYIRYRQFLMLINLSNKISVFPDIQSQYKAYICKGNNGVLVKTIVKSRPWWTLRSSSDIENCSLIWTQWKKTKLTNSLPSKEIRSERISFYTTNYYQRINQSLCIEQNFIEDEKNVSRSQNFKNANITSTKLNQIYKIAPNIEKFLPQKYLNTEQLDSSFYLFTKKICDKKFEQVAKRYYPSQTSYYNHNIVLNKKPQTPMIILNHVPGCLHLHSKRLLYLNMKKYYERVSKQVFDYLPQTHLIKDGLDDPNFEKFIERWQSLQTEKNEKNKIKNVWICKPGDNSNRGNGITVMNSLEEIKSQVKFMNGQKRSIIIQKYLENPYLYNRRKFDIRCYLLITTVNGIIKGYFFNEGYIRTTSKQYNLKNLDNKFIHLTNDAIQKKGEQYGKFESCNKVSFPQFEKYLESFDKQQVSKFTDARRKIKQIVVQLMNAVSNKINMSKKQLCFQLFGLDFMLDSKMKPFLIEGNSNPCLEVDGSVLSRIIPAVIQNTIKIAVDPLFPPPYSQTPKFSKFSPGNVFENNKFQLIYDSLDDPNAKDAWMGNEDLRQMQQLEQQCDKQQENQFEQ